METQSVAQSSPLAPSSRRLGIPQLQELGLLVVIAILGTILTIYGAYDAQGGPNTFLNLENLVGQIATYMAVYAIMAVGQTVVIITGGIDISVGAIYALSAMACAGVLQNMDPAAPAWKVIPVALLVAPGVGLLCGVVNGLLITLLKLHPFIVTLGTMSIIRCIANVSTGATTLPSPGMDIPASFTSGFMRRYFFEAGDGMGGVQLMPLILTLIVVALGWFFLRMTIAGRETYAVGGNEEASRFSGIRVNWVKLRAYALSGLTAGIAGAISLGWFTAISPNDGTGYELSVIAAAVVGGASLTGGRGTALGAMLGALVIRMIENAIFKLDLHQQYSLGIVGAAIIVAAAIDQLSDYLRKRRLARLR